MSDLEAFDALIGTWTTEATHPMLEGVVVPGRYTFEWLEGGKFLIQRSTNEHELFPDSISVIGAAEGGTHQGVLRLARRAPDLRHLARGRRAARVGRFPEFAQRYAATLGPDAFEGLWQVARTPGDWQDDLQVTYRR